MNIHFQRREEKMSEFSNSELKISSNKFDEVVVHEKNNE